MGNPSANPSAYESQQIQTEYEVQPQEYEPIQEAAPVADEYSAATYQNNQQQVQYQAQQMGTVGNDPQTQQQQQFQPSPAQQQPAQYPPPQQPAQYTPPQQPTQYPPPQPSQAYPPPQPAQYPPQYSQNNPMYQNRSNPNQPAAYPPEPVQFPPKSPQTNQMYSNVSPGVMPHTAYAPSPSPQAFPQPGYLPPDGTSMPPASPYKPVGQTAAVAGIPVAGDGWRSGLFDFMDDPMNALVTAFFPCLTFGQIAEIVDDGHTSCGTSGMLYGGIAFCIGMPCLLSCTYRTKLRNKFGLPEAPAPDWVTHFLCEWCALCQEYRELQHRGWDPSIGWQGNLAKNQNMRPAPVMMAPMNQRMMA